MTVGEGSGVTVDTALLYTSEDREELDTVFEFEHLDAEARMGYIPKRFNLRQYKKIMTAWQDSLRGKSWGSLYWENHDQPRALGRITGSFGGLRKEAAKMLALSLYMMQGTPYIYQGQELGMTNCHFEPDEYEDVMVRTLRATLQKHAPFLWPYALKVLSKKARDLGRTPMQWTAGVNAGFSSVKPWLKVNPDYININAQESALDSDSVLNFYKKLIKYRKGNIVIRDGSFHDFYPNSKSIFCYERVLDAKRILVVCNFKNKDVHFKAPQAYRNAKTEVILHNYEQERRIEDFTLKPFEALVFETI
jgi:oligo-1,6-glucosidase